MNTNEVSALTTIRVSASTLSPKLRNLAELIIEQPDEISRLSVDEFSSLSSTSVATIYRFCRALGFQTFSHLKLALVRELSGSEQLPLADSTPEPVANTRLEHYRQCLEDTKEMLSQTSIVAAAQLIMESRHILIAGAGSSSIAARFMHYKLLRAGIPAHRSIDQHISELLTSKFNQIDLVIAFSASGETREIIKLVKAAKSSNAKVVGITCSRRNAVQRFSTYHFFAVATQLQHTTGTGIVSQISIADSIYETLYARSKTIRYQVDVSAEAVISKSI